MRKASHRSSATDARISGWPLRTDARSDYPGAMPAYTVRPLTRDTWSAYADLIERHNGVWGGCWCLAFHPKSPEKGQSLAGNRSLKQRLVEEGKAHAAVVFEGDVAVGWCQYGTPAELPTIYHRKQYEAEVKERADYRITCFFVDRDHRRSGVAGTALAGALDLIARSGGGAVEAFPQDTMGTKVSASFLYNGTRSLFERHGFTFERPKGKNHCVMRATVAPA